jgi:putative toxin-antitoxin system antitoxin component (TIGR02293 family)
MSLGIMLYIDYQTVIKKYAFDVLKFVKWCVGFCHLTYIRVSNDGSMSESNRRKSGITRVGKTTTQKSAVRTLKKSHPSQEEFFALRKSSRSIAEIEQSIPGEQHVEMEVIRNGKKYVVSVKTGYGYMVPSFTKAGSLVEISTLVENENGIPSSEIAFLVDYLDLNVPEIAKAADVSTSTVSRWKTTSHIGKSGAAQFFKMDEVVKKGVDVFGNLTDFKRWLDSPNMALGNVTPKSLITSPIGVDRVDASLDALNYGNVI